MTRSGIPSRDISTAWACRSWWGANRRLTPAATAVRCSWAADRGRGAWPPAGRAAQNAEERADRQGPAQLEPGVELLPRPSVHPDLPPATALPARTSTAPRGRSRSVSASASASLIRRPARQSTMINPRSLIASGPSPAARITDDLLRGWRVRRIAKTLVARDAALVKAGQGRPRPAAPGTIQQSYRFHDVLLWTTVEPHDPPAPRPPRAYGRLAPPAPPSACCWAPTMR